MTRILAIDTATEACSVAVAIDGQVKEIYEVIPRQHSQRILTMVSEIMADSGLVMSQLDAVAFGRGPGAFTGVRIATGVTQGLAFALDRPVIPVSTLAALAQQGLRVHGARQVLSAIDARMDEVYWGQYLEQHGLMAEVTAEQVCTPENVSLIPGDDSSEQWLGMGSGWVYRSRFSKEISDSLIECCCDEVFPHAIDIAALAVAGFKRDECVPAEQALPVYLRDNVALKKSER